jgi:tRNA threonylcarbamoyladenosine biosynthesis protein TsaE
METRSAAATRALGRRLGATARPGDALLLFGPVGAGKTVLADGFLAGLQVPGPHPSPTFTLMRLYTGRLPVAHLDLYRLVGEAERAPEDVELDLPEFLATGGVVVVEWAEALPADAVPRALTVRLVPDTDPRRRAVVLAARAERAARWAATAIGKEEAQ